MTVASSSLATMATTFSVVATSMAPISATTTSSPVLLSATVIVATSSQPSEEDDDVVIISPPQLVAGVTEFYNDGGF
ncbi:uncharacterized protein DS421_11g341920 [Arachis hypogaea]|nr:uncharacterized protein DS421_11g341920 [Arachis hypogaea]